MANKLALFVGACAIALVGMVSVPQPASAGRVGVDVGPGGVYIGPRHRHSYEFFGAASPLRALNAMMSSGASRHHSPDEACQRLQLGQPVSRSPQWSISTKGWSHCLQRLDTITNIPGVR
jgi:hypothetical protein